MKEDDTFTTSKQEMQGELMRFYGSLIGTWQPTDGFEDDIMDNGQKLSREQMDILELPFTKEQVKEALYDIGEGKSPGPDGYTSCFFKKAWNIIGDNLCGAVLEFFEMGKLLRQVNHSIIALILKVNSASKVADFRPISCCNVVYKIIAKLIATRVAMVLPYIIDKAQSAFVKDRSMVENIHLAQEIMRGYARKRTALKCTLKIDI